jgi:FkbM family methyltransferase
MKTSSIQKFKHRIRRVGSLRNLVRWGWDVIYRRVTKPLRKVSWLLKSRKADSMDIAAGVKIRLSFNDELVRLIYMGEFENKERNFVWCYLRPGDVFLDIGANIGVYSLLAACRIAPTGIVHAFEPDPFTFDRLSANVELNGYSNVQLNQIALSDAREQRELLLSINGFSAYNSFTKPLFDNIEMQKQIVECTTLDDYIRSNGIQKIDLIKIDVEGWEIHVIAGGHTLLSRADAPTLLVEFNDVLERNAGFSNNQLYDSLIKLGYSIFRYDPFDKELLIPQNVTNSELPDLNLIATKDVTQILQRLLTCGDERKNG